MRAAFFVHRKETMKTAEEFYRLYSGKKIDDDGVYGAQCVDGFRVFCRWAGIQPYPTPNGWADGYWYGRASHPEFEPITGYQNFRNGDWVIWARHSGSHPSSHIAMWYNGMEFGENQGGNGGFTIKATIFSDALGALRWKGFETMNLVDGLQTVTYGGITYRVVHAPEGFDLRMMSASGEPYYTAVQDITQIDSDKLLVKAKVNANYFEMANSSYYGQHYGVEQSETLDLAPKQAGILAYAEKTDGTIVTCPSDQYTLTKSEVNFGCSPYAVRIHNGVLTFDRSTSFGDKDHLS